MPGEKSAFPHFLGRICPLPLQFAGENPKNAPGNQGPICRATELKAEGPSLPGEHPLPRYPSVLSNRNVAFSHHV